ncbi:MAG: hypothetical protein GX219_07490 [Tissierellia bacterium]|nr:hypothetical protein [Tissierellia bacterium]
MRCKTCGKILGYSDLFCPHCGEIFNFNTDRFEASLETEDKKSFFSNIKLDTFLRLKKERDGSETFLKIFSILIGLSFLVVTAYLRSVETYRPRPYPHKDLNFYITAIYLFAMYKYNSKGIRESGIDRYRIKISMVLLVLGITVLTGLNPSFFQPEYMGVGNLDFETGELKPVPDVGSLSIIISQIPGGLMVFAGLLLLDREHEMRAILKDLETRLTILYGPDAVFELKNPKDSQEYREGKKSDL